MRPAPSGTEGRQSPAARSCGGVLRVWALHVLLIGTPGEPVRDWANVGEMAHVLGVKLLRYGPVETCRRQVATRAEGEAMSQTWGSSSGWLSGGCQPTGGRVALVRSTGRKGVEVERTEGGQSSYDLVVYVPTYMPPTAVLAAAKPYLSDDECAAVAHALGF